MGAGTGTVAKWTYPRVIGNLAWEFCLDSDVCLHHRDTGWSVRNGNSDILEFIGESGLLDSIASVLFCGYKWAKWGLNFMRNGVFAMTWVYSSARLHLPELNSRDTPALPSFIRSSEINAFDTSLLSLPELLRLKLERNSAYIRERDAKVHKSFLSWSLHLLCWNDEKRLLRAAEFTFY